MLWTHGWVTRRAFCFKDRDMDDLEEGKISTTCFIPKKPPRMYIFAYFLVYWIIYEKSIKGLVCWSHLNSYRRVRLKSVLIPVCFFLQDLLKLDFNDTLVSSTRTFPVNIFNLEGGETMLARDKGNFHAPGKDRPCDPPVQWLERPIFIVFGGSRVRFLPGHRNFLCPGRAWFLLLPSWKCSLEMYVCCSLVYH